MIPLLEEVGVCWEEGTLSVAHEHFASNLLRQRLSALAHQHDVLLEQDARRPHALLACPPGERQDLTLVGDVTEVDGSATRSL